MLTESQDILSKELWDKFPQIAEPRYCKHRNENYLSDDYSVYFTEEEKQSFNERLNGVYTGLGVEITNDSSNNAMVVTVFDDSSAKEAGIKPGDIIAKINGKSVLGLGKDEVVKNIKGKNNYSFNMTVLRDGNEIEVKVITKSITLSSVSSEIIESGNKKIGYIYISIFALNTYDQFKAHLESLEKEGYYCDNENWKIEYMTPEVHYNIWNSIYELYPEDIDYKDGVQNYLQYCVDNGITKEFLDKENDLDAPDIMEYFEGLAKKEKL